MEKLLASSARGEANSLIFSVSEAEEGGSFFLFAFNESSLQLVFHLDPERESERESGIRAFFKSRSIEPSFEQVGANSDDADTTLAYDLQRDSAQVSALMKQTLVDVYGIQPHEMFRLRYRKF